MKAGSICLVALAGCSQILGIDELSGPSSGGDAKPADGKLPDGPVPPTIQIAGTTRLEGIGGTQSLGGVALEYFAGTGPRLASTQSDANGLFTLSIPSNGSPLTGYIQASSPNGQAVSTATYLARPVTSDTMNQIIRMASQSTLEQVASFCNTTFDAAKAIVVVAVFDAIDAPVTNASVLTQPSGRYCTLGMGGLPSETNVTGPTGEVFAFQTAPGMVLAGVTMNGMMYPSRTVTAMAGALTAVPLVP